MAQPAVSQYSQGSDPRAASRTRSGSNARRRRSGPVAMARKTRRDQHDTTSTTSAKTIPKRERELTAKAIAPTALSERTRPAMSRATALTRIRLHASPISARSSVLIAPAIAEAASMPAARAGAAASTHATPATAYPAAENAVAGTSKPRMTIAAPAAVTPQPSSVITRLGSLPKSASSGAATAATEHAYRHACIVWALEATKIGINLYSTTIPITDQTACAMADAAGGATITAFVTHE